MILYLSVIGIAMLVIFIAFTFFFRLVKVDGASMNPTLNHGDRIIISNFLYNPDYGDIIAVGRTEKEPSAFIKRIIALGGDEIFIDFDADI